MFERFTEEARQVVVLAQEEARHFKHSYIGTEHILLGLLREEEGRPEGERTLASLGITLADARNRVARIVGSGEEPSPGQIPFTPRAKKVLELALREALNLGGNWIGPEHVLLGVVRENEGVASRILLDLDADAEKVRNQVIRAIGHMPPRRAPVPAVGPTSAKRVSVDAAWVDGLAGALIALGREIRERLERDPDIGDLLLAIACAKHTIAGEALNGLGVDVDALWGTLERARQHRQSERDELTRRIGEVRARKELAIENQEFDAAAKLRDEQRELSIQLDPVSPDEEFLREVRRRLGLAET